MDESGLMRPGPTRALADDLEEEAKRRGLRGLVREVSGPLSFAPGLPGVVAGAAGEVADKGWATGLLSALSNLALGGAVRNGPQKLEAMVPASLLKGKIDWRDAFNRMVKSGTPKEAAYRAVRGLPMLNNKGELVDDLWVPGTKQQPKLNVKFIDANYQLRRDYESQGRHGKETFRFEDVYAPGEADKLLTAVPEIAKTKTTLTTGLSPEHGEVNSLGEIRIGAGTPLTGTWPLVSALGHEGTHKVQDLLGYPQGGNTRATDAAKQLAITDAVKKYVYGNLDFGDPRHQTIIEQRSAAANSLGNIADRFDPGTDWPVYKALDDDLKKIAMLVGWRARIEKALPDPDYKLYRALHGEQTAEGAARHANALPPKYTAPLSKQIINLEDLESGNYQLRMQRLYDAILAGKFPDPKKFPYEHFPTE